jgi:hypothetical protein
MQSRTASHVRRSELLLGGNYAVYPSEGVVWSVDRMLYSGVAVGEGVEIGAVVTVGEGGSVSSGNSG